MITKLIIAKKMVTKLIITTKKKMITKSIIAKTFL